MKSMVSDSFAIALLVMGVVFFWFWSGLIVGKIHCTIVCKLIALFVIKDWQHVLAQ